MTEETAAVAIARMEATLNAIKNQIDYSERSSQQLVRMVDERFTARFDTLERRLDAMDASRERARKEDAHLREMIEQRIADIDQRVDIVEQFNARLHGIDDRLDSGLSGIGGRLDAVEKFNVKLIGIAIGVSVATGGSFAVVLRAIGVA